MPGFAALNCPPPMRSLRSLRLTPSFFAYFACFAVQNTHLFPLLCSFVLFCGHPPWLRRRRIPTLHSALFSLPFTLDFRCALVNTAFVLMAGFGSRRDPGGSLWPAGRSLTYPSSRSSGWNGGESHCKRGVPPRPGPFCPPARGGDSLSPRPPSEKSKPVEAINRL